MTSSDQHFYKQCGVALATLAATAAAAMYLPALAPFCFSVGITLIVWNEITRDKIRTTHIIRKIQTVDGTTQKIQRDLSKLREDVENITLKAPAKHLQKPTPDINPAVMDEIEQYENIIRRIRVESPPIRTLAARKTAHHTPTLSDNVIIELLKHAIDHDRVELFAQPIVRLPQRRVSFYELFSRLRAGTNVHVSADRYLLLAQNENLIPALDNVLLLSTLKILREQDVSGAHMAEGFFLNLSTDTLNDAKFVNDLLAFVERHTDLAARLIFEFSANNIKNISAKNTKILAALARLGCRYSVDHVTVDLFTPHLLSLLPFSFVKMDVKSVMTEITKPVGLARIKNIKSQLDHAGVALIFDRIEGEPQLLDILDFDVDYGQGYLFGASEPFADIQTKKPARKMV